MWHTGMYLYWYKRKVISTHGDINTSTFTEDDGSTQRTGVKDSGINSRASETFTVCERKNEIGGETKEYHLRVRWLL